LFCSAALAADASIADTRGSAFAKVQSVGLDEVRWTDGFWADRFETCRAKALPALWRIMEGTNYSQFYENFRIAAGLSEGRHRGAPFNDGDFYKWLEAACAVLAVTHDAELDRRIDEVVGVIAKAQREDGYLHTPILIAERRNAAAAATLRPSSLTPFKDPLHFEMYNMGHLLTAACVHYRITGRTNLLVVARKTADFLEQTFREPTPELARNAICPSHYMGLVELYRATKEPSYLDLAKKLIAMRDLVAEGTDDNQDRTPFEQQTNAMGHAVRANYLYGGAADLFLETGDPALWGPLERIWTNVVQQKLYITGGCGALYDGASPDGAKEQKAISRVHQAYGRNFELPNLTAHSETCANIGNVLWNWRMFLSTGEARFVDTLELTLFNSVLSGMDLEGTNYFYVNPLRSVSPMPVALRWTHERRPFLSSFCCPPNLARTIAEVAGYAYGKSTNTLWINLYGSSRVTTRLAEGTVVSVSQETDFPWNGRVRIKIEDCSSTEFALRLRIPGWTKGVSLRINDKLTEFVASPGSYAELGRKWRKGDVVDLDLPMPTQLIEANPLVEETLNQIAVKRGPLVYCLESADLPKDTRLSDIFVPAKADLIARYDRRLLGGVVVLEGGGIARQQTPWNGQLYRELALSPAKAMKLRLIPYFSWANRGPGDMSVWLPLNSN
jgi:hypothetical protein